MGSYPLHLTWIKSFYYPLSSNKDILHGNQSPWFERQSANVICQPKNHWNIGESSSYLNILCLLPTRIIHISPTWLTCVSRITGYMNETSHQRRDHSRNPAILTTSLSTLVASPTRPASSWWPFSGLCELVNWGIFCLGYYSEIFITSRPSNVSGLSFLTTRPKNTNCPTISEPCPETSDALRRQQVVRGVYHHHCRLVCPPQGTLKQRPSESPRYTLNQATWFTNDYRIALHK
ncbi:hypothetical protein BDW42DRAFT_23833 [Aspergillus taichungensis]|uniref:Uncharacterized protein n=1 Tax=Aspergillus taichungensis TaxID=482145 RepID=A0A2J5HGV9_9EURO|nr:hypothetical protein BDW42DRAFT_23833 [Aspergillus taichungensis]